MKHRKSGNCKCQRCASIVAGATPAQADAEYREWERSNMQPAGNYRGRHRI